MKVPPRFRQLFKSPYIAQLFSLGGSAALTFFSALFLVPEERGLVAVFLAVLSVGSYVACFGVQSEILQRTAKGDEAVAGQIIRKHIPVQLVFAAVIALALIMCRPFQGMSDALSYWAAAGIFTGSLFNNLSWRQYGAGRFFLSTALRGVIPFITLTISFVMYVIYSVSAEAVASIYVAVQILCMLFLVPRSVKGNSSPCVRMLNVYRSSGSFFLCQAESLFLSRTPVIAAGIWLHPGLTAAISISLSLAELQSSLPQMRSAISFKEASATREPRLTSQQLKASIRALIPGTVVVFILAFVAREFLDDAYSDLPIYVALLSLGVAFQAVAASAVNVLTARRTLKTVILVQFLVIAVACLSLSLFSSNIVPLALAFWSVVISAGLLVIIILATRRKRGRHL